MTRAAIALALTLAACGGSSRERPPIPTVDPPAPTWKIVPTVDPALRANWPDYGKNLDAVTATVRQWAVDHGRELPAIPTHVIVMGEWACAPATWASRRGPQSVSMRLIPVSCEFPTFQRREGWAAALGFELAMRLAECNGGAGGHCGDEHLPTWDGYTQPAAADLDRRIAALVWDGPDVALGEQ